MRLMLNYWPTLLACWTSKSSIIAWQAPAKEIIDLRSAGRRLNELTRQKAAAKNQFHTVTSY
ncbi:hypothetical protein QUF74_09585 [Candidatus Halobeggiatoa sp. HSG11]|nr:hypothetical protein [Candidatus Halobeggiatoa sp. HSG11]